MNLGLIDVLSIPKDGKPSGEIPQPIVAIVGDIRPVIPTDREKQKITLADTLGNELRATIHGAGVHLPEDAIGKKIKIEGKPWLSIFEDGGCHLTIRDNHKMTLKDMPKEEKALAKGVADGRLATLAAHYDKCLGKAKEIATKHGLSLAEAQPIGTCLYMDTKAQAMIAPAEEPIEILKKADDPPAGEPPKKKVPAKKSEEPPKEGDQLVADYCALPIKEFRTRLMKAIPFKPKTKATILKREAIFSAADAREDVDWREIYDLLWHKQDTATQQEMDSFIKTMTDKYPDKEEAHLVRAFCNLFNDWKEGQS